MDETDPSIQFNSFGVCDHCIGFYRDVRPNWNDNPLGRVEIQKLSDKIRDSSRDREFDCIIGLSGGLDSSYLLHLAVTELKLRPLVFHVDGGWNTDISVSNVSSLVDALGLDLLVEVVDWDEMRDFQLSLFKSGLPSPFVFKIFTRRIL